LWPLSAGAPPGCLERPAQVLLLSKWPYRLATHWEPGPQKPVHSWLSLHIPLLVSPGQCGARPGVCLEEASSGFCSSLNWPYDLLLHWEPGPPKQSTPG
ncbi:hypothetical protein AVEN_120010-1, partial [Araneus ventricosus]